MQSLNYRTDNNGDTTNKTLKVLSSLSRDLVELSTVGQRVT
ncbi:hypothetical protein F383_23447 [Gossypium arboreum]|uniref:Uncharacterized protein n=1 Tax=Gossypium arboreum TaxID=29729 RepID=A0A0B0P0Z3_GOSAR|nr:hypothetical protein F383_23447 [Gossypium arboreum]